MSDEKKNHRFPGRFDALGIRTGSELRVSVTTHSFDQFSRRVMRGVRYRDLSAMMRTALKRFDEPPDDWKVPRAEGFHYRALGQFVLVFGPHPTRPSQGHWYLVSVVGPLSGHRPWKPGRKD